MCHQGNLEFMDRHTTIDQPYYEGPGGIVISSIDILPTELRASELLPPVERTTVLRRGVTSEVLTGGGGTYRTFARAGVEDGAVVISLASAAKRIT